MTMSVTYQEPEVTGLEPALVPGAAEQGGDGPAATGGRVVPLRELVDDGLLDALLERSRDEAGGGSG
jgi:hypothetical protein